MDHRYRIVDVFTERPLAGNPLAVFPDASHLDEKWMQPIARELNLSETVFVLPATRPDCVARIRIFTPARELIFAGHPTIGAAFVLLQENLIGARTTDFLLEEKVGPVSIRIDPGERPLIWLRTPPIEYRETYGRAEWAAALGLAADDLLPIDPQLVSAGNPTIFIAVKDKDAVDRAFLEIRGLREIRKDQDSPVCIFVFAPSSDGAYSRMFAPEYGVVEDPATGSSTGPLASFMMRHGLLSGDRVRRFISEQGTKMGRRSILHVRISEEDGSEVIHVGGHVTPLALGTMSLDG